MSKINRLSQLSHILKSYTDPKKRSLIAAQINHSYFLLKYKFEKDFIFIHINKTAGSSISALLDMDRMHLTAFSIRNMITEESWNAKFKFSFVRNPWDRVVSQYHHRYGVNQQNLQERLLDFKGWVKEVYLDRNKELINFHAMFMPQLYWISDMNGSIIVDYIGRYENLQEDIAYIKDKLNISKPLPHLRKSKREHYSTYYDNATKNIVGDFFKKDIEYFKYEF
ncbi:MAG: sulfotransferase family 2 domain-containing protein [Bacteroidota bacterium]